MAERVGQIYYDVTLETGQMVRGQREVQRQLDNTSSALDRFDAKLTSIARAIGAYAAALLLVKAANTADDVRLLGSRMEVAAGSADLAASAMQRLQQISAATQTSIAANVQVFTRLNQSILQMGGTQQDTLAITELLAKAVKVSGASAQESASAMIQFGQALGSGKLAGDELRSLLENAPYLMRQLADGLGVPIGALKSLGEQGKLTADVVVNALSKASATISADFDRLGPTLMGAFTVAQDAAARATQKFDELSGTSGVLTGMVQGLGQVLDKLAEQFGAANLEASNLGRNDKIGTWAESTRLVLSYVADTLDIVKRGVQGVGITLAGLTAIVDTVKRLESGSPTILKEMLADLRALGSDPLAGAAMRNLWEQGAGAGRGFVNPAAAPSKLTAPAEVDASAAKKARDAAKKAADERLKGEMQALAAEAQIRDEQDQFTQKFYKDQQDKKEKADADDAKRAEERKRNLAAAQDVVDGGDPIARLERELQRKTEMLESAAALDLEKATFYAQAQVALEEEISAKKADIWRREAEQRAANDALAVSLAAGTADQLYQVLERAGKERTALGKALFLTSKALAVAEIIMNAELGASKAMGMGPFGVPMATYIRAAGYASAGIVAGLAIGQLAGGRQYGGPASAGNLYRVNETGQPEMFTASNGAQYFLPTKDGRVTPSSQLGGGVSLQVQVINNHPTAQITTEQDQAGAVARIVVSQIAGQIRENSGEVWSALRGASNVQPRNNG